jgi:hypothetical protein
MKATISPPTINDDTKALDDVMLLGIKDASTHTDWTDADDDEALTRHGISPNYLFLGKRQKRLPMPRQLISRA